MLLVKKRLLPHITQQNYSIALGILISLLLTLQSCFAEESVQFHVDATSPIIYCDISPSFDRVHIQRTLQEGSPVTFSWHIEIETINPYWINEQIADISFYRQIMPDLITRQWRLEDNITGITHHTPSMQSAIDFISKIEHFPLLDKSLLEPHQSYLIQVYLSIENGEQKQAWWADLLSSEQTIATSRFTLP